MINIPTELLRTLVAVVDLRSFTKAANSLGVTQPAVSAQIKRLQLLLGCDLFDKSAPGVSVTAFGALVVNHARRILSINDQIVEISTPRPPTQALRIGIPGDFVTPLLPPLLATFKLRYPALCFVLRDEHSVTMSRDLRQGELDLMIAMSETDRIADARHQWTEPLAWVRKSSVPLDFETPVPLVTFGENCALHRAVIGALDRVRRPHEVVFVGSSETGVLSAVSAGLGITALPYSRADSAGFGRGEDGTLPPLADVSWGICLSEIAAQPMLGEIADAIADVLRPKARQPVAEATALSGLA